MADVRVKKIRKAFGTTPVLGGVDLDVADGEFLTLVGPSGCGKSTMLRVIAGLEPQDGGTVEIGGAAVDHLRPHERNVAMVFQSYALYPHMSVFNNIALPLVMAKLSLWERLPLLRHLSPRRRRAMKDISGRVMAIAEQLQIEALLHRRPAQLSGGQRQRVALGRAMVRAPDVFLMDEPLSNLDAKLRVHMRSELAELHARLGATFIYVTHDQVEAMTMSDTVAVMEGGHILQHAKPADLYERPANLRVAQFIGSPAINLLAARVGAAGEVELADGVRVPLRVPRQPGTALTVGVRPEAVRIGAPAVGNEVELRGRLRRLENLGPEQILHFDLEGPVEGGLICRMAIEDAQRSAKPDAGGQVRLHFSTGACHLFDAEGVRLEPDGDARVATAAHAPAGLSGSL